jgi:MFS transporter, DHA3 family, macrolide efflux protein
VRCVLGGTVPDDVNRMDELNQKNSQLKQWKISFFSLWTGQAFSLLGSQLVQFALIWWLTKTTGKATVLATAALVGLLPQVLLGPLMGVLVDRWNRRKTMIAADSIIALSTLGLVFLFNSETVQVWHIYVVMFIRALLGGFHWAAWQASTSMMVPKQHLSRVQGANQALNGALNIGSAPLGAVLMALLPMGSVLMVDVLTAVLAITPLFFIPIPQPEKLPVNETDGTESSVLADMRAGFKYVMAWPGLLWILAMATIINLLLTPASALMPILVSKYFGGDALQLAWTETAWGIGVVSGGLILGVWGGFKVRIKTSVLGLLLLGGGMAVIGFTPATMFYLTLAMMFVTGLGNPLTNGPIFAVIQSTVAPEMQGRVMTLMMSVAAAMAPLGLIIAGPISDWLGVQTWFVVGGLVTLLIGMGAYFIPAIAHIEEQASPVSAAVPAVKPEIVNSPAD